MKVFFLYLLIITHDGYYHEKITFGYTLRPITCDEAFEKTVKFIPNPKYKDGEQLRDFIYVKDVVDVLTVMMTKKLQNGLKSRPKGIKQSVEISFLG